MAFLSSVFGCVLFAALCLSSLALAVTQDLHEVVSALQDTVHALSREARITPANSRFSRRDATFRTGRAGYWHPLGAGQRRDGSDNFPDEINSLINEIGDAVQHLLALLASEFNPGQPIASSATSKPTSIFARPSISPVTNPHTTSTVPTTSRSLVPDRPLSTSGYPSSSATYTFNPQATDLNVAYYSQTDLTSAVPLNQVCSDPSIDIVILAFVTRLIAGGGYPAMNMASNCWAPTAAQQAAGATGLLDCIDDGFSSKIAQCQQKGKKVFLSLGGSAGDLSMSSDAQAVQAANTLWNLFLGGTDPAVTPLRPYGNVVLDGIDIGKPHRCLRGLRQANGRTDNEGSSGATYLPTLARTLRQLMSVANKPYYLSAAPQCPRPDVSVPIASLLPYIDFFSVQFYNNPSCNLDAPNNGFLTSLQNWSSDLLTLESLIAGSKSRRARTTSAQITSGFMAINNGITAPRLLIGTAAFPAAAAAGGYVSVPTYINLLTQVKALGLPNLAGAMFWDGSYLQRSGVLVNGVLKTYAGAVKDVFG
jgi:chitinase